MQRGSLFFVKSASLETIAGVLVLVFALDTFAVAQPAPAPSKEPAAGTADTAQDVATQLEGAVAAWTAGGQAGAVTQFMAIKWKPPRGHALFGMTEKEFVALPQDQQAAKSADVLARLKDLRALCRQTVQQGKAALDAGDKDKARKQFQQVRDCGKWITAGTDDEAIIKAVGKALQDMGEKSLQSVK